MFHEGSKKLKSIKYNNLSIDEHPRKTRGKPAENPRMLRKLLLFTPEFLPQLSAEFPHCNKFL